MAITNLAFVGVDDPKIYFKVELSAFCKQKFHTHYGFVSLNQMGQSMPIHFMAVIFTALFANRCTNLLHFKASLIDKVVSVRQISLKYPRLDIIEQMVDGNHDYKELNDVTINHVVPNRVAKDI